MIKNKKTLLSHLPRQVRERRRLLLAIASSVITSIAPQKLFTKNLFPKNLHRFGRFILISIGKAASSMATAACSLLTRKPDEIFIANKGHPLPTQEGVVITKKIIAAARNLRENDLAIVLLSGGGSAMLTAPVPEISLEDKIRTTKALLRSGASIQEVNVVRKHLSEIKGGRLASLLYPAAVFGFVISDVPGNDLSTIASGPLSPDGSSFANAVKIIKKYHVHIPQRVSNYLEKGLKNPALETPKPGEKYFEKVTLRILADHTTVLKKAVEKAKKLKIRAVALPALLTGEARVVAPKFIKQGRKNALLLASGETTVTCRGKGFGGRNQEFVLAGLPYLKKNQTLLSIGTDGVDGICPGNVAGAVADFETLRQANNKKLKIDAFLKRNDSYTFFKKTNGLIKTGMTGTNLGDLVMLYCFDELNVL